MQDGQNSLPRRNDWSNVSIRYLTALCVITVVLFLLSTAHRIIYYLLFARASTALHNKMFQNVLRAQMRFFDVNPVGIILNRFSKDMGLVDNQMPGPVLDAINVSCQLIYMQS
jgi:ATP-binding cassette subfamily C (CFTR/MRP) protein 4